MNINSSIAFGQRKEPKRLDLTPSPEAISLLQELAAATGKQDLLERVNKNLNLGSQNDGDSFTNTSKQ